MDTDQAKHRISVTFPDDDYRSLQGISQRRGVSLASVVRDLVRENLDGNRRRAKRLRENLQKYGGMAWPWPSSDLSKPGS